MSDIHVSVVRERYFKRLLYQVMYHLPVVNNEAPSESTKSSLTRADASSARSNRSSACPQPTSQLFQCPIPQLSLDLPSGIQFSVLYVRDQEMRDNRSKQHHNTEHNQYGAVSFRSRPTRCTAAEPIVIAEHLHGYAS